MRKMYVDSTRQCVLYDHFAASGLDISEGAYAQLEQVTAHSAPHASRKGPYVDHNCSQSRRAC